MKTTFKILKVTNKVTYIGEYWDDILIFKYTVYAVYNGGDVVHFMNENHLLRNPNFNGIDEFHRRTFILDF